jgi:hypothetical protein
LTGDKSFFIQLFTGYSWKLPAFSGRASQRGYGAVQAPQHFLYFLPLPQGQASLRPTFGPSCRTVAALGGAPST